MTTKTRRRQARELIQFICDADKRTKFVGAALKAESITARDAIRIAEKVAVMEKERGSEGRWRILLSNGWGRIPVPTRTRMAD